MKNHEIKPSDLCYWKMVTKKFEIKRERESNITKLKKKVDENNTPQT